VTNGLQIVLEIIQI